MAVDTKYICDNCGADCSYTSNSVDYRLILSSDRKQLYPGAISCTDMYIAPDIDSTKVFCDFTCLKKWVLR